MARTIQQWQDDISNAANKKFPKNNEWSQFDRLNSIQEQLDDVSAALKVEAGELRSADHAHQDPDHRIAALIADILILADMRKVDLEAELSSVLDWFSGVSQD